MKNYLKLHRLAFRKRAAGAAVRDAADTVRDLQGQIRDKERHMKSFMEARIDKREAENGRRSLKILEAELERLIAVRDIASEELSRLKAAFDSDATTFRRLHDYLAEHRELIPEGIPNGL
ncbi:hypothetical protein [Dyella jiangningensis]|uniref:Uncharacterized protein n=1 Tax=Dyella jiangningensis TaxID=1379159 RepID=A0A328P0T3_9GAMM|nr:hypothetical protein [Dyella jiangningensis]RAO75790.1 hypothetical protein CA260_17280 [Dyella jiangningensis]